MSFQEKSAWVMLGALIVPSFLYFNIVIGTFSATEAIPSPTLPSLIGFTVITVIIAIIGHIVAAVSNPKDANANEDERSKLIVQKAGNISSYVFALGVITGLGMFLLFPIGSILFYICFASLVLSHLVEYSLHIYFNRTVFY